MQYFYPINYKSYFVIFTRKSKKVCKSVCKSQNVCPIAMYTVISSKTLNRIVQWYTVTSTLTVHCNVQSDQYQDTELQVVKEVNLTEGL